LAETVRVGIIGYGMGKYHAERVRVTRGLELAAVCDIDPRRVAQAQRDFPGSEGETAVAALLARPDIDLVVAAVPHNAHAEVCIAASQAGKHVVIEKPMCITPAEGTAMIDAAHRAGTMLTVHHNRRWDGDYMALKDVLRAGLIGEVYHVEMFGGGYHHPGGTWRADKAASGGAFYDWGAHYVDWLLGIVPSRVKTVTGFARKLRWLDATNEDDVQSWVVFENGVTAHIQMSNLARVPKSRWRILGTLGGIEDAGNRQFRVNSEINGYGATAMVPFRQDTWQAFYDNVAAHLLRGEPLAVPAREGRRVIGVIEATDRSAQAGGAPLQVPYEEEFAF
jgi:predicted dehydrogenase